MSQKARLPRLLDAWGDPLGSNAFARARHAAFLLLVLLVAFYDLGSRSLHTLDLPRFGVLAREMISTGEWLVPTRYGELYANKPPLHIWLVATPALIVGEVTPFLVRWPSALGLVLLVVSTSAWGRLRCGVATGGRMAALLLLGTYAITRFGREGRPDMLASGLIIAATFFLDRAALGKKKARDPWIAGLLLGLALLAKGPVLLLFPAVVLLLPSAGLSTGARFRGARPHVVMGVALVVVAVWLVPAALEAGADYVHALVVEQASSRLEGTATHVEGAGYYARRLLDGGAPWTPMYLAPLLLLTSAAGRRRLGNARSLVAGALALLVVFSLFPTKHLRYVLPVFPLLALGAGALLGRHLETPAGPRWRGFLVAQTLTLLTLAASVAVLSAAGLAPALLPASTLPFLFVPLGGLLALVPATLPFAEPRPADASRRLGIGMLLVAVALVFVAYWGIRDRYRVRTREAFDRAVAAKVSPGLPVFTLAPVEPAHVFNAAPEARFVRRPADLPGAAEAPHLVAIVEAHRRAEVERVRGSPAEVLLATPMGDHWPKVLLLRFGLR